MTSFEQLGILTGKDVAIQVAPSSFDVHVKECIGTLMLGSSLVLLHPQGHLDLNYLSKTIQQHNVTFFCIVPSHMTILSNYLTEQNEYSRLRSVRKFGFLGMFKFVFSLADFSRLLRILLLFQERPLFPKH